MPEWELVSFIKASDIRFGILETLNDKVQTPTELKEKFNVPISRISSVLKELLDAELVENLTPDRRKGKMFNITSKGKKVLSDIQKFTGGE